LLLRATTSLLKVRLNPSDPVTYTV